MESHEDHRKEPQHNHQKAAYVVIAVAAVDPKTTRAAAGNSILWSGCLLATTLVGVALMAFWVVSFHDENEELWMVPVSLIMVFTPVLVWLSAASDSYLHKARPHLRPTPETPPAAAAAVVPMDHDLEK